MCWCGLYYLARVKMHQKLLEKPPKTGGSLHSFNRLQNYSLEMLSQPWCCVLGHIFQTLGLCESKELWLTKLQC